MQETNYGLHLIHQASDRHFNISPNISYFKTDHLNNKRHTGFSYTYNEYQTNEKHLTAPGVCDICSFYITIDFDYIPDDIYTSIGKFLIHILLELGQQLKFTYTPLVLYTILTIKGYPLKTSKYKNKLRIQFPLHLGGLFGVYLISSVWDNNKFCLKFDTKENQSFVNLPLPNDIVEYIHSFLEPPKISYIQREYTLGTDERYRFSHDPQKQLIELTTQVYTGIADSPKVIIPINHKELIKWFVIYIHKEKDIFKPLSHDPLESITINHDNNIIHQSIDPHFARITLPIEQTGKPFPMGMYLLSFCLSLTEPNCGSATFKNPSVCIQLNKNDFNYRITLIQCNYNVAHYESGFLGISYKL